MTGEGRIGFWDGPETYGLPNCKEAVTAGR